MPRSLFASAAFVATVAAFLAGCGNPSGPLSPVAQSLVPAPRGAVRPAVASSPLDYIYTANYNGNDIAQLAFNPKSKPMLAKLAPNFVLPASCKKPDSLAMSAKDGIVFVSCFSGEVLALKLSAKHTLLKTTIAPVAVPSPLFLLAPPQGAAGALYATEYPGAVAALHYSKTALRKVATYQTGAVYPDEMAFSRAATGALRIFVASPLSSVQCGTTTSGGILVFLQAQNGSLKAQTPIPACGAAYNVVAAGTNLLWAGPSVFGAYSLVHNKVLPSPKPLWSPGAGPPYYAGAMSIVVTQQPPKQLGPDTGAATLSGIVDKYGNYYVVEPDGTVHTKFAQPVSAYGAPTTRTRYFSTPVAIGTKSYRFIAYTIQADGLAAYGFTTNQPALVAAAITVGNFPIAMLVLPTKPCGYSTYYYYGC